MTALPRPEGETFLFSMNNRNRAFLTQPKVGDLYKSPYGHSQFAGSWTYRITRISKLGDVFGVYESGEVYELDIEDCI